LDGQSTIERLNEVLEAEEASEAITVLPPDHYVRLASYAQKLRAGNNPSNDDASGRLARKQLWLIEAMTRRLLELRLAKARKATAGDASGLSISSRNLLPEERYVSDTLSTIPKKEERFVKAVADGQPSFFSVVQDRESRRMTSVRLSTHIGEIIGVDLKTYGPFEANDVARIPVANAQAMILGKLAVPVSNDEY
jgi:DNA replication initiation complex subunit (GINS family)